VFHGKIFAAIVSETCVGSIVSCIVARLMLYFYKYIYVLIFYTDWVPYIPRDI